LTLKLFYNQENLSQYKKKFGGLLPQTLRGLFSGGLISVWLGHEEEKDRK